LIEHGLTSPPTQYRLYGRRVFYRSIAQGAYKTHYFLQLFMTLLFIIFHEAQFP